MDMRSIDLNRSRGLLHHGQRRIPHVLGRKDHRVLFIVFFGSGRIERTAEFFFYLCGYICMAHAQEKNNKKKLFKETVHQYPNVLKFYAKNKPKIFICVIIYDYKVFI